MTNEREQRGLMIAATCKLTQKGGVWLVPSQSADRKQYTVCPDKDHPHCTCPDHETRGCECKHIFAVRYTMQRELFDDGSIKETQTLTVVQATERKSYPQNWTAYNSAQTSEKAQFQVLLRDLCAGIAEPERKPGPGRPPIPLRDAIFSACFKVYSTVSGRRFMTDLREAHEKGHISRMPCYNSIFNVLEDAETFPVLKSLVARAAAPLKAVESNFACDSSGFSACRFDRWYDHKHGDRRIRRAWVKTHVMCGVKTNVITAVEIHGAHANDGAQLPDLVATTAEQFTINEVSADLAYSTHDNLLAIALAGGKPMIPFKSNASAAQGGMWARMLDYFRFRRDEFLAHYHRRSNVETSFSMVKRKFGDFVRSKCDVAMRNEVLAKLVCHNICCVIQETHELGIDPVFWAGMPVAQQIAAG